MHLFSLSVIMKRLFVLLLMLLCYTGHAQVVSDSLLIEGHYRLFHFHKPSSSLRQPSLVFVLHGSGGSGLGMRQAAAKMEQQATSENALVVYPDGYKKYWNECRKASPAEANLKNINEQAFFKGMIEYFHKHHQVNTQRVFVAGTSGGGHMAYKLALTMPESFKGVTAIIANLPEDNNFDCTPVGKPIALMIVNGTQDEINPYQGGEVKIGFSMGYVRSTEQTFHYWASLAGYKGNPVLESVPDRDPTDGKLIERYTYLEKGKKEIVLLKVIGGKHDYPNDLDVHVEAWKFFKRQQ
jgi:polyhydroxybutyrate depolymerase